MLRNMYFYCEIAIYFFLVQAILGHPANETDKFLIYLKGKIIM